MANITQMIADLDQQIASLQTARDALASAHGVGAVQRKKRKMSPESRKLIAEAQKKRWALVNKAKKSEAKKEPAKA